MVLTGPTGAARRAPRTVHRGLPERPPIPPSTVNFHGLHRGVQGCCAPNGPGLGQFVRGMAFVRDEGSVSLEHSKQGDVGLERAL
jgi:hypothetical protein